MKKFTLVALVSLPLLVAGDLLWLGVIAHDFYWSTLGSLIAPTINWGAIIAFYILYVIGLTYFATLPALKAGSIRKAFILGGLFGFFTYMTYDLTNLGTLRDWSLTLSLVDMAWGFVLSAFVSSVTYLISKTFKFLR